MKLLETYDSYLKQIEWKIKAPVWMGLSIAVSVGFTLAAFFLLPVLWYFIGAAMPALAKVAAINLTTLFVTTGVVFVVLLDLMIGYPYFLASARVDRIEADLPDVLKQFGDTLKAGGTYEYALREIAESEYGPLKKEINNVVRKLEEGENFETAFSTLSENVNSRLVKRTVTIIVDSIRAGAALADVLEDIAEDVRAMHQIHRERRARTTMQVMFMVVAGGLIAPMIFGFVSTIATTLIRASLGAVTDKSRILSATEAISTINLGIQIYLIAEIIASSVMMSLMREGKISKSIIYFPVLLLIAYASYLLAQIGSEMMMSGMSAM